MNRPPTSDHKNLHLTIILATNYLMLVAITVALTLIQVLANMMNR